MTVIVIDPTTQTDDYMISAHTEADGMLNISIVMECYINIL